MPGRINKVVTVFQGLFKTDKRNADMNGTAQLLSRFIWELPNTILGLLVSIAVVLLCRTQPLQFYHGATFIKLDENEGDKRFWAMALGTFIIGSRHSDTLLSHEYGHCIQSRLFGPFYLIVVGLPSLISASFIRAKHSTRWFEKDANARVKRYMEAIARYSKQ